MNKALYLLTFCFLTSFTFAQSYQIGPIPYDSSVIVGGTTMLINQEDEWSSPYTLPFTFCFHDSSFSTLWIGSNGLVTFTPQTPGSYCLWPIGATVPDISIPPYTILGPWHDINPSFGGSVTLNVLGVAPYRSVIISYNNCAMFSCTGLLTTQQIRLFETTNIIEMHIKDKPLCTTWNGGYSIQAIQINNSLAYVVPGRNYPTLWAAHHDAYAFIPTGNCSGLSPNYTVQGRVFADVNANCVFDSLSDFPIANRAIIVDGGQFYTWTNFQGHYSFFLSPGIHGIEEWVTSPFAASSCLPAGPVQVNVNGIPVQGVDFADSANFTCSDLQAGISAVSLHRCATSQILYVSYANSGPLTDSNVVITIHLHDSILPWNATHPYVQVAPNTYEFSIGTLPCNSWGSITIWVSVGCEPAGTIHCFDATIHGDILADCDSYDNTDVSCIQLNAPGDPNSKQVAAQQFALQGYVTDDDIDANDTLLYQINFQNVGTSPAEQVEIHDRIDSSHVDIQSLEIVSASHSYVYTMVGSQLIVRFDSIFLPDSTADEPGSHGFIRYRVRQRPGNLPGTVISNHAAIYFDHEPAVITNVTHNTIPLLNGSASVDRSGVTLHPNPGGDRVHVSCGGCVGADLSIYDLAGHALRQMRLMAKDTEVDTGSLPPGMYIFRVNGGEEGMKAVKWIRE